ncbi:methylase [Spirochaetia bacterium]|nr:methylase [Spirochaetia bacterium]
MPLSWNEIRSRASAFILEWKDSNTVREKAEAQTFETEFLKIFGIDRKKVALFEHEVHFEGGNDRGYIDLFWPGHIIIEMKTPGKDLDKAFEQAKAYALTLPQKEIPKAILTSDFLNFQYYDLEDNSERVRSVSIDKRGDTAAQESGYVKKYEFPLEELTAYLELFSSIAGYTTVEFNHFDPVNIIAAERMGKLHNYLKASNYEGHPLEMYLVRLLFCFFADASGIFPEKNTFTHYIANRTNADGSDLALHLGLIFDTLNKPPEARLKNLDDDLKKFPYVNGGLFAERLETAAFDSKTRETLLWCCALDWSKISPAIFGAMFQSVMNDDERHDIGAHYTSEDNIMKLIRPLFLGDLQNELDKIKALSGGTRKHRLLEFHDKLCRLKFLDPACGCGNFLVISYRELRKLEMAVIKELLGLEKGLGIEMMVRVNVDQFYGIEIEEFPARIAQTAMWLMDHLMNNEVSGMFGAYIARIPLTTSPSITIGNALTIDWETIVPRDELSYILGNPPFLGYSVMNREQKAEVEKVFDGMKNCGVLDYVTAWYKKAALYMQGTNIETAFVSTNSICQGEQVPALWPELMNRFGIKINFAHQTFKWSNEARGKAAVYCVIIGFGLSDRNTKKLYHYATVTGQPAETMAAQINPYLIDAPILFIDRRTDPLCNVSPMIYGNKPVDDGHFFLDETEKDELLQREPALAELIKPFLGAHEYINNVKRYCIWLKGVSPVKYANSKEIQRRLKNIKTFRENSTKEATKKIAEFPTLFGEIRQPESNYIIVPRHSSEQRKYIPLGFVSKDVIVGDSNQAIPNATLYEFGIITSTMHMAWMRYVCGRLELRYRYSNVLVYNNFPWPKPTDKQREVIETAAQEVLDARTLFPDSSLANLYDENAMPPELKKAHQRLDKAVEKAYGKSFVDDTARVAYLFELYQKMSGELFVGEKKKGRGKGK